MTGSGATEALLYWMQETSGLDMMSGIGIDVEAETDTFNVSLRGDCFEVRNKYGVVAIPRSEAETLAKLLSAREEGAQLGIASGHRLAAIGWLSEALMMANAWHEQHHLADSLDLIMKTSLGRPHYQRLGGSHAYRPEQDGFTVCCGAVSMWLPVEVCRIVTCALRLTARSPAAPSPAQPRRHAAAGAKRGKGKKYGIAKKTA